MPEEPCQCPDCQRFYREHDRLIRENPTLRQQQELSWAALQSFRTLAGRVLEELQKTHGDGEPAAAGAAPAAATAAAGAAGPADAADQDAREAEIGDLLFAVVNWARKIDVDPEAALRRANSKFEGRFRAMESMAGDAFSDLDLDAMEALWQKVKRSA